MKTYLFVDGSNLYAGQYELFGPDKYLNFAKFVEIIERKLKVKFDKVYFYASYSPRPKRISEPIENYLKNEGLFYQSVRKIKNIEFYKGHRSMTSGKEKGVDVALASDLVRFSCEKKYKYGYLITGDADFQHCLEIAIEKKRIINIIAIENRVPCRLSILYNTYVFWFKNKPKLFDYRKVTFLRSNIDCVEKIKTRYACISGVLK